MFDWKILGATFAALIVVSTLFVGGFGIKDFFSQIFEKISEWLGSSPFSGFQHTKSTHVHFTLYPENFVFSPDSPINITLSTMKINNFKGKINTHFKNNTLLFSEDQTDLKIETEIQNFVAPEVSLKELVFKGKFIVTSTGSNITAENETISVYNFLGVVSLQNKSIVFSGNVTKIKGRDWEII